MSITSFSSAKRNNFTMVDNDFINNPQLTLEAKHLLTIFLSNSEDWKINMTNIVKRSKNGRDKHYACLRELITYGYVARIEIHNGVNKRFEQQIYVFSDIVEEVKVQTNTIYKEYLQQGKKITIYHQQNKQKTSTKKPLTENPNTGQKPFTENPNTENPDTGKPNMENPHINNKNSQNKNFKKTNPKKDQSSLKDNIVQHKNLPETIKDCLMRYSNRLIDDNISILDIESNYKAHKELLTVDEYESALDFVLSTFERPIASIKAAMTTAITKKLELREKANQSNNTKQCTMPKWWNEEAGNDNDDDSEFNETKGENIILNEEREKFKNLLEERIERKRRSFATEE